MRFRSLSQRLAAAITTAFLVACGADSTTAPNAPANVAPNSDLLGLSMLTKGLLRTTPLANDITVQATIGSAGGTISVPGTGFVLTVPRNAVTAPTAFSVTAKAGSIVAYEFEPHGKSFPVALGFDQSLNGTNYGLLSILSKVQLGYFANASQLDEKNGVAWVTELLPAILNLLSRNVHASISHFSGYMVSSG